MYVLRIGLDFYFAALLGVSGLAKAEHPSQFGSTLRRHRVLPALTIPILSYIVPWAEILLAIMLALGTVPILTAGAVLVLFSGFLIVQAALLMKRSTGDCGCYGAAFTQRVEGTSVATSFILLCLALVHLWTTTDDPIVAWQGRVIAGLLLAVSVAWVVWRGRLQKMRGETSLQMHQSPASNLNIGDPLPLDIGVPIPPQAFVVVVSPLCHPCVELCEQLAQVRLDGWSLIMLIVDVTSNESGLRLPPSARVVFDQEREWFRQLDLRATPTALCFVDGRLVGQQIGITPTWFSNLSQRNLVAM